MKLLRVVRLDDTDERVYEHAAKPGEWAVVGSFAFTLAETDPGDLTGKARQAFLNGFLGVESFGRATVTAVTEISEGQYKSIIERLAYHIMETYGAPTLEEALPFAREEAAYTRELAEAQPDETVLAVERTLTAEGISETFKTVRQEVDWGKEGTRVFRISQEDDS